MYLSRGIAFILAGVRGWLVYTRCIVCRFYARTSRHYVEMHEDGISKNSANLRENRKCATHLSRPPNYLDTVDITADHVTTGNGQYFVLDAEAVNREAFQSAQQHSVFQ